MRPLILLLPFILMAKPSHGMPTVDLSTQPAMSPGATVPLKKLFYGVPPSPNSNGQGEARFWVTVASYGNNDPIVKPGQQGASHGHVCWGNPLPCLYSNTVLDKLRSQPTIDDATKAAIGLVGSEMQTTADGGSLNLSTYWAPYMVDTMNGKVLQPSGNLVYYKTGLPATSIEAVNRPINGLRIFTGDPARATPYPTSFAPKTLLKSVIHATIQQPIPKVLPKKATSPHVMPVGLSKYLSHSLRA